MSRALKVGLILFALLVVMVLGGSGVVFFALQLNSVRTIVISREEIQQRLETKFPVEKNALLFKIILSDPVVILHDGDNQIGVDLDIAIKPAVGGSFFDKIASLAGRDDPLTGTVGVTGDLSYRPSEGVFYMSDPTVHRFEVNNIPSELLVPVREAVGPLLRKVFIVAPVYKLDQDDWKESFAKSHMISAVVKDGALHAEIDFSGKQNQQDDEW